MEVTLMRSVAKTETQVRPVPQQAPNALWSQDTKPVMCYMCGSVPTGEPRLMQTFVQAL